MRKLRKQASMERGRGASRSLGMGKKKGLIKGVVRSEKVR